MENLQNTNVESHHSKKWGWILSTIIVLCSLIVLASFTNMTSAASLAQAATPTMPPMSDMTDMPGMNATPTAIPEMPGMVTPTATPVTPQVPAGNGLDVLIQKMQAMMTSLQGMLGKLDQKSASLTLPMATPTATSAVDMPALMAEMQSINQVMGPLMLRIQADLQGSPTTEELAAVRTEAEHIYTRMANLMAQMQAPQEKTAPVVTATPTMALMPGIGQPQSTLVSPADPSQALATRLGEMMQKMQELMQQMQSQQSSGMSGMVTTPGTPTVDPSTSKMMSMMDDMLSMMNGMAGMGGQGNNMNMATPTPWPERNTMPEMTPANPGMNGLMMNDMLNMMDDMMKMMDSVMEMMGDPGM